MYLNVHTGSSFQMPWRYHKYSLYIVCEGDTVLLISGVARVLCALGQEIFLRPTSTELAKFELKNRCKSAEEAKADHLL